MDAESGDEVIRCLLFGMLADSAVSADLPSADQFRQNYHRSLLLLSEIDRAELLLKQQALYSKLKIKPDLHN